MTALKTCTNKGCALFHEGTKGWSCCSKRVFSFDEFLEIPGCTKGRHSDVVEKTEAAAKALDTAKMGSMQPSKVTGGEPGKPTVEVYNQPGATVLQQQSSSADNMTKKTTSSPPATSAPEDPENVSVAPGTHCKRNGCGYAFKEDSISRGKGSEALCNYHPGVPIFHEGSKGWSCCPRKVLEFEEFLKISGCKAGKHLFVGGGTATPQANTAADNGMATCRHDWYQTQTSVIVSIYAKKVDPATVVVQFQPNHMTVDFTMPDGKKFHMETRLFQTVDVDASKYKVMGTKVELTLRKSNGISWASLEHAENVTSWTTFGLTGTKGTVGGKEMHIAGDAPIMALNR